MTLGNITYGQWRTSWSRRGKVYDAPAPNHPTYGSDCLMCNEPMKVRPIQLIAIGLTDDENEEDTATRSSERSSRPGGRSSIRAVPSK